MPQDPQTYLFGAPPPVIDDPPEWWVVEVADEGLDGLYAGLMALVRRNLRFDEAVQAALVNTPRPGGLLAEFHEAATWLWDTLVALDAGQAQADDCAELLRVIHTMDAQQTALRRALLARLEPNDRDRLLGAEDRIEVSLARVQARLERAR